MPVQVFVIGAGLMWEYLVLRWHTMPWVDYLIMLTIVLTIAIKGCVQHCFAPTDFPVLQLCCWLPSWNGACVATVRVGDIKTTIGAAFVRWVSESILRDCSIKLSAAAAPS